MAKMKSFLGVAGVAALASLAMGSAARAEDERQFTYSFNIGAVSDYMFRGFSQRDDKPAIQGGADIGYGIFYAGVWLSNVEENFVATSTEYDLYAGIKPVLGPVTFDFGVIYYGYPSQDSAIAVDFAGNQVDVDYVELKAAASMSPFTNATVGVNFFYSPDYSYETGNSYTVEGTVGYTLPQMWVFTPTISALVGYQDVEEVFAFENSAIAPAIGDPRYFDNITYWNAGIALNVEKLTIDLRYYGCDRDVDVPNVTSTGDRFVFGVKVVLP